MDYALDLKNFHLESHNKTIVPILVATEALNSTSKLFFSVYNDQIYNPLLSNSDNLMRLIEMVLDKESLNAHINDDMTGWANGRYSPTPTIIEAASALYQTHSVEEITRHEAAGESLDKTTEFVLDVINRSKEKGEHPCLTYASTRLAEARRPSPAFV